MFHVCKVTVVKRSCDLELVNSYVKNPDGISACDLLADNQEFLISNPYEKPDGLCSYAWADIRSQILAIATGGSFDFLKDDNTAIATCTDLFRPVIFKIERVVD